MTKPDPSSSNRKVFFHNKLAAAGMLIMLVPLFVISGYPVTPDNTTHFKSMPIQLNLKKLALLLPTPHKTFYHNLKNMVLKEVSAQAKKTKIANRQIIKKTFCFGTDTYDRDMLSQLIIGGQISPEVGFASVKNMIVTL